MNREDARKLIGGYAAGILTEAERRELFSAALEDQTLFDELMREEPLRELLEDPASRRELRSVLAKPEPRGFWWTLPVGAVAGTLAVAAVLYHTPTPVAPLEIAQVRARQAPGSAPREAVREPVQRAARPRPPAAPRGEQKPPAPPPAAGKPEALVMGPPPTPAAIANESVPVAPPSAGFTGVVGGVPAASAPRRMARTAAAPPAPPPPLEGNARQIYYAANTAPRSALFAPVDPAQLGLRYTRDAGTLTVEANAAGRLRVFAGDELIFDSPVMARARAGMAAPEGKPLRLVFERPQSSGTEAARVHREYVEAERATYVVAEPQAASLSVTIP
jgi:hypothetical protein